VSVLSPVEDAEGGGKGRHSAGTNGSLFSFHWLFSDVFVMVRARGVVSLKGARAPGVWMWSDLGYSESSFVRCDKGGGKNAVRFVQLATHATVSVTAGKSCDGICDSWQLMRRYL